jgi:hypothetical protein
MSGEKKMEPEQLQLCGGYDHEFVGEVADRLICQICTKVMREPYLAVCCGNNYCKSCLKKSFVLPGKESCPHCRAEGEAFNHVINKGIRSEINQLKVKCTNREKGCEWTGELPALKKHLESENGCKFVIINCRNKKCQVRFERILRDKHESECLLRPYQCEYCGLSDTYQGITGVITSGVISVAKAHHSTCPAYPFTCPNKCGASDIKRKDSADHRRKCPLELVECSFAEAGCTCRMQRRQLDNHIMSNQQEHLLFMMKAYKQMKGSLQSTKAKLEMAESKLLETEAKFTTAVQLLSQGTEEDKKTVYSIIVCSPSSLKKYSDNVTVSMPKISEYYRSGKIWYSPPFYYKEGYKICLVVSGVKMESADKCIGLTIGIKLLQGENDDKLRWPIGHTDSDCPAPQPSRLMESEGDEMALSTKCVYTCIPVCRLKQLEASECQRLSTSADVPFRLVNDCLPFRIEHCDCYVNIEVKCSNKI